MKQLYKLLSLFVLLTVTGSAPAQVTNEQAEQTWDARYAALRQWVGTIKSINLTCTVSRFIYAKARIQAHENWQNRIKANPNTRAGVDDANEAFIAQYVADQVRWRIDQNRIHPKTGLDFKQYFFDGGKYTYYDDYYDRAIITARDEHSTRFWFNSLDHNMYLGIGEANEIEHYHFERTGDAVVEGRKCQVFHYVTDDHKSEVIAWLDNQTPLLLRTKEIAITPG